MVQRDWYSSFLLYNMNVTTGIIDKDRCIETFNDLYNKEKALISWIKANGIKIMNSGIRT